MKQELRDKWVRALREGEFAQFRNGSCNVDLTEHCCLDVLRIVAGIAGGLERNGDCYLFKYDVDKQISALVGNVPLCNELAARNDGRNGFEPHDFNQIADWIEENVEVTPC